MKVLVLGAGGIGGYFGGRLAAAGIDVRFLVRPSRAKLLDSGLVIKSPLGDFSGPIKILIEIEHAFDAVLLACKSYDLAEAVESIAPAVGPSTVVLPLLNGVRHLDVLDDRFGTARVLGGLCHIGVTVDGTGAIQHLNTLQKMVLGARAPQQTRSAVTLHALLQSGGFAPLLTDNVMQEMWEKFMFLATYAGITTLMRAPVGTIATTQDGREIACEMLAECSAIATATGYPPRPDAYREMQSTLTDRNSTGTASMYRDMIQNNRTEHDHILGDMVARAKAHGISAPLLRLSFANMEAYEVSRLRQAA